MAMRGWWVGVVGVMIGLFSAVALASSPDIRVVDLQRVVAEASQVKAIRASLEAKFTPRQKELMALQSTIKQGMEKYQRDASVMTEAQKKALQQEIQSNRVKFDAMGSSYEKELNTEQNKAMQSFFEKVKHTLDGLAQKGHYDLVLQKEAVPFAAPGRDVTESLLKALG